MSATALELLADAPFFEGFDPEDLAALARRARTVELAAGQRLFAEGEPATAFYLLASGAVEVAFAGPGGRREADHTVTHAGHPIGWTAVVEPGPRAPARAARPHRDHEPPAEPPRQPAAQQLHPDPRHPLRGQHGAVRALRRGAHPGGPQVTPGRARPPAVLRPAGLRLHLVGPHVRRGRNVVICPEGASTATEASPLRLRAGAFRLAAHVRPEPLLVPVAVANFDKKLTVTATAAVVQRPFRLSEVVPDPSDDAALLAFLNHRLRPQFRRWVREAAELAGSA